MSDTLQTTDDMLLRLLAHGWGELTEDDAGATLTLIVAAKPEDSLSKVVARVELVEQPGDVRRYIVRGGRIQFVHLIRRQDKAPA